MKKLSGMVSVSTTMTHAKCSLFVLGTDMNCPLCGVLVKSGERHSCSMPEKAAKGKK